MAEPSSQQQKVNEIVANLEARKLAEKNVEEAPIKKERGVSILLGKKPKYKTSAKKNESKVIPLANSELIGGGEESASMNPILVTPTLKNSVEVKEKEPEVSLDKQLRLKKETEKAKTKKEEEEKAKKRKEEEAQIAKDMGKGALNRRASIRDEMRKSQIIMNIKPEEVSEDKLAEDMGSQFQGLWDKLGMAAAFTKRIKENVVTMASRVHPQEVLERVTAMYPRRKYVPVHHSLGPVADHEADIKVDLEEGDVSKIPESEKRRRGAMKNKNKSIGECPFYMLQLTQDELDYFYGAFCDVAGAGPDDNPEQISLEQLVDWFYKVEYRFKTKDLKRDNNVLRDNILSVHYYDRQEVGNNNKLINGGLIQPTKLSPKTLEKRGIAETGAVTDENGETMVTTNEANNGSMGAEKKLTKDQEQKIMQGKAKGAQTYMTFVDFVLSMWNFLSADEVVMTKNLWEYIEIGMLRQFDGKGIIPLSKCEDLVQVWHPKREGKLKKNDNKRKKNKASTMYVELEKTCHIEKDEKGRVVSKTIHFGNFASLCKENRSFTFGVTRLQLDIMACLMGASFWKRQQKFRQKRFGLSNLYYVLRGEYMLYEGAEALTKVQMKQRADGLDVDALEGGEGGEMEEGGGKDEDKDPEELKEKQIVLGRATLHEKKERMRLGKTIFLIDLKRSKGERLTAEESWLLSKATAQAKTANKIYMRMSKREGSNNTMAGKMKRAKAIEEEDDDDEGEEEDKKMEEAKALEKAKKDRVKRALGAEMAKQENMGWKEQQKELFETKADPDKYNEYR